MANADKQKSTDPMDAWEVISQVLDYFNTGKEPTFKSEPTPDEKAHGKVVGFRRTAYHDITVYEDGYEDWYYIGD